MKTADEMFCELGYRIKHLPTKGSVIYKKSPHHRAIIFRNNEVTALVEDNGVYKSSWVSYKEVKAINKKIDEIEQANET